MEITLFWFLLQIVEPKIPYSNKNFLRDRKRFPKRNIFETFPYAFFKNQSQFRRLRKSRQLFNKQSRFDQECYNITQKLS